MFELFFVKAHLSMILAALLWASSFVVFKLTFEVYSPWLVIFGRMLAGSLLFISLLPIMGRIKIRRRDGLWLLLLSLSEPCLYFIFEAYALQNTSASQAGIITSLLPLMVAIAAGILFAEQLRYRQWSGLLIAFSGALMVTFFGSSSEQAPHPILGNFLEFCAMLTAVVYTLVARRLSGVYSPLVMTAAQSWIGALFFLPFAWGEFSGFSVNWLAMGGIVYLGIMVTGGAYFLYNWSVGQLGASLTAAYINLIPVFTLGLGITFLGERLSPGQWLGVAAILVGTFLSQYRRKPAPIELLAEAER